MKLAIDCDGQEAWNVMMDNLSQAVKDRLEDPPTDPEQRSAFLAFYNILHDITEVIGDYLPPGDRKDVLKVCGIWFDLGLLFGTDPQILVEILKKAGAKVVRVEDDDEILTRLIKGVNE